MYDFSNILWGFPDFLDTSPRNLGHFCVCFQLDESKNFGKLLFGATFWQKIKENFHHISQKISILKD